MHGCTQKDITYSVTKRPELMIPLLIETACVTAHATSCPWSDTGTGHWYLLGYSALCRLDCTDEEINV